MFKPEPIKPQPGQESVWDYPRPPRLEASNKHIQVIFNQIAISPLARHVVIADSHNTYRVLETSHPPVYYIPPEDIQMQYLSQTNQQSFCEWKGRANYYTIQVGDRRIVNAAWFYPNPTQEFAAIKNYVAFYPSRMDACYVDGEQVESQPGDFYGGWITKDIVGPFKGSAGSWGW
jgi:uncharacterized protein (DUF427 family)